MHDFDVERRQRQPKTFRLGGEEFVGRVGIRPEEIVAWEELTSDDSAVRTLEVLDTLIMAWLFEEDHERWRRLRERRDDPISAGDLHALVRFLLTREAGQEDATHPTTAPGDFSAGRERRNGSSEVASSSTEATPAA